MSAHESFAWCSITEESRDYGYLRVLSDGSLVVIVDDDYYNGTIGPAAALRLAKRIIACHVATPDGLLPLPPPRSSKRRRKP